MPQRTPVISRLDLRITCAACQHMGSPASFLLSPNQQVGERCLGIFCQEWPRHSCDTRMAKATSHSFSFIGPCYAHSAWCQLTPPARSLPAPPASLHFSKAQCLECQTFLSFLPPVLFPPFFSPFVGCQGLWGAFPAVPIPLMLWIWCEPGVALSTCQ